MLVDEIERFREAVRELKKGRDGRDRQNRQTDGGRALSRFKEWDIRGIGLGF